MLPEVAAACREALFECARACGTHAGAQPSAKGADLLAADACARSAGHCLTTYMLLESVPDPAGWVAQLSACARACSECAAACFAATTVTQRCVGAAESCRRCVEWCARLIEVVRAEHDVPDRSSAR
jgi:hypothetical protein